MASTFSIPDEYWKTLEITKQDIETLHTHLFEIETPLTAHDLASVLIENRVKSEIEAERTKRESGGKMYLPNAHYAVGDDVLFPSMGWAKGKVMATRPGRNPEAGEFEVVTVEMQDGVQRLFASALANHALNNVSVDTANASALNTEAILRENAEAIEKKIELAFSNNDELVKIAGRWFPRGLLIDINEGHLNLAEAVLDVSQGEPQPTSALLKDIELSAGINPKLAEFSLNYALQSDSRFDEVGPAGEVQWCLRRLEPDGVRDLPSFLRYEKIDYDRSVLDESMLKLETQLDDELSEENVTPHKDIREVTISLIYPHLRAGTLPVSPRTRSLFPTAYESPRVRFTMVDARSGIKMPGWVVREHGYVFGLREWYKSHQLMPGSLVAVRRGQKPGEVIVEAKTQRSSKDWVRTLIVGADGGLVFAMLKQPISAEFNDRMAIYVSDFKVLDPLWDKNRSFEDLVVIVMRELTKLNPQGHVHAQELYAAVNLVRRIPPAPLFALLATQPRFIHVGDLHFRLEDQQ
ncbi:MAG TPA: hypothetical protein VIN60_00670 [Anaerolineales bacterium]